MANITEGQVQMLAREKMDATIKMILRVILRNAWRKSSFKRN